MIYFLITIISLLVGYVLGRVNRPEDYVKTRLTLDKLKDLYKGAIREDIPTGQIKSKTADDIRYLKLDPKKKEGLKAMKETLDNIPKPTEKDEAKFYG